MANIRKEEVNNNVLDLFHEVGTKIITPKVKVVKEKIVNIPDTTPQEVSSNNSPIYRQHNTKKGWLQVGDKKIYVKSKWEKNIALYLEWCKTNKSIKDWWYEPDTFWFEGIKRGVCSYKPDFKLLLNNDTFEYIEVKGFMDNKSKTKMKRMKKYYPKISVRIIGAGWFSENNNAMKSQIEGWEK